MEAIAMKHKYQLNEYLIDKVSHMSEFANGATQVSIVTKNGTVYREILISNSSWIIAMRGQKELPFSQDDIADIYQSAEDKNPKKRGNWFFWDDWKS
jgi:hypothetical protein